MEELRISGAHTERLLMSQEGLCEFIRPYPSLKEGPFLQEMVKTYVVGGGGSSRCG
jgi:hypothetical protein